MTVTAVRLGLLLMVASGSVLACGTPEAESGPVDPCRSLVADSAAAQEIDEQIELIDRAISVCLSFDTLAAELALYPGAVGVTPEELVRRRCAGNAELEAAALCRSIDAAAATEPSTAAGATYVGLTLDDREVEITPADTRFTDDRPAAVVEIEAAAGRGCEGLLAEYVRWFTQITNPVSGDEASVYARYALDLMRGAGCPPPE